MPLRAKSVTLCRQAAALLALAVLLSAGVRSNPASRLPFPFQGHRCAVAHSWQQVQDKDSFDLFVAPAMAALPSADLPALSVASAASQPHFERVAAFSLYNRPPPRA